MRTGMNGHHSFLMAVVLSLAVLFSSFGVQAADWKPSKPIQFIVPYAPGGGSDVMGRTIENIIKTEKL